MDIFLAGIIFFILIILLFIKKVCTCLQTPHNFGNPNCYNRYIENIFNIFNIFKFIGIVPLSKNKVKTGIKEYLKDWNEEDNSIFGQ